MYVKSFVLAIAMVIFLPIGSHAQSLTTSKSFEDINATSTSVIPNGSVVVISKEETANPEYVHTKYAFVDQACGGAQLVDHYGPPIEPTNRDLKRTEQRMCTELAMDARDGD